MRYFLVETQSGGCDYTIGCGLRVSELPFVKSTEEAKIEAAKQIGVSWRNSHEGGIEGGIDGAKLLVVSEEIDLESFLNEEKQKRISAAQARKDAKQKKDELAELERLAKKHGKTVQ